MSKVGNGRKKIIIIYLTAIHLLLAFLIFDRISPVFVAEKREIYNVVPFPSPLQIPSESNNFPQNNVAGNQTQNNSNSVNVNTNQTSNNQITFVPTNSDKLTIPVVGIKKENLLDTFADARSENRVHNAIDIAAPQGTAVVAVADGEIARFFDSEPGGITIYQFSKDRKFVYYYGHLQKRAENLQEKVFVSQGTVIGYVGDTGNAGAGNFHLHFSISIPNDLNKYWEGENINPFPLLKDGIEARTH